MFRITQIGLIRIGVAILTMSLGFFFILVGSLKITPALNESVYREMRKVFIRQVRVFPFVALTGWTPNPHMVRSFVGVTEIVSGIIIILVPGPVKELANIILLLLMCFTAHSHIALDDPMERLTPSLLIIFAILMRYALQFYVCWCDVCDMRRTALRERSGAGDSCTAAGQVQSTTLSGGKSEKKKTM